jgi:hypothetical protein
MDLRNEPAPIPNLRIDRRRKHNPVDIVPLRIIDMVCGVESGEDIVFSDKFTKTG